jgi:hypothetical protein
VVATLYTVISLGRKVKLAIAVSGSGGGATYVRASATKLNIIAIFQPACGVDCSYRLWEKRRAESLSR